MLLDVGRAVVIWSLFVIEMVVVTGRVDVKLGEVNGDVTVVPLVVVVVDGEVVDDVITLSQYLPANMCHETVKGKDVLY